MFKGSLLLLLVIYVHNSSCALDALYQTGRELWKFHLIMDKATNREKRNQMDVIHEQLNRMEESMDHKVIHDTFKPSLSNLMLLRCMDILELFISSIDEYYIEFRQRINESNYDCNNAWPNIRSGMTLNVGEKIGMIRKIVLDAKDHLPNEQNLVTAIAGYATSQRTQSCNGPHIISDVLFRLFRMVILSEIKGNLIQAFANLDRYRPELGWINLYAKEEFEKQFGIYVHLFSLYIESTEELYMRACDPDKGIWIRDESFYELEGTFQTTAFSYHRLACESSSCNDIWLKERLRCNAQYYSTRASCSGTLTECAYLGTIQACALKSGPRKFQYVNSTILGSLGKNFTCPKGNGFMIRDGTGSQIHWTACACNCYGSHNKISLKIMESRVQSNKVIIGLRFIRKDQILYIQPREGILDANGHIRRHSERWIPIPKNLEESEYESINRENRIFFLDDLRFPAGFVLTGVKFNKVTRRNATGFAIEIFGLPFNHKTGQLDNGIGSRQSKQEAHNRLGQGLSFKAISSVDTTSFNMPSSESMKYVSLARSELPDDFGQSTLPLFDAALINSHPSSALGGIGIFHKGTEGYAGFISLRVYGISYAKYFLDFESSHTKNGRFTFDECQRN